MVRQKQCQFLILIYRVDFIQLKNSNMFDRYSDATLARFKKFHAENPNVYEEFKRLTLQMKRTGRQRYSAYSIMYVLRWENDLKTKGDVFLINNDFIPIYARVMIHNHPELENFFETREPTSKGIKSQEQRKRERELENDSTNH
jgi:hypothetical protein